MNAFGCYFFLKLSSPSRICHQHGYQCSLYIAQYRALRDTTTTEGDRERMREARRISTYQVTQKDLFLMFRKMSGVENDYIKDSYLFLSFRDGPVYQKKLKKNLLWPVQNLLLSEEKNEVWEREAEKWEPGWCLALFTVIRKVVLICLWTDEVKALLLGVLHCQ